MPSDTMFGSEIRYMALGKRAGLVHHRRFSEENYEGGRHYGDQGHRRSYFHLQEQSDESTGSEKESAAVSAKKTDRVEFGFEAALTSARSAIAAEVRADASPQELLEAQNTAQQGVDGAMIAAMMFMG